MPSDTSIDKLIAAREEIDRQLRDHHSRNVTILFTDIVGSTEFFERKGDIEGVALVQRHNRLLFPMVEKHRGRVIKTIGDAIMAVFDDPTDSVRCAAAMQRVLVDERQRDTERPIHIRIGAHAGTVMNVDDDVFGDAVNTAARVAAKAEGGEILLSASLFDSIPAKEGLTAVSRGALPFKGKAEPLPVVALVWRQGDSAGVTLATRTPEEARPEIVVVELGLGPTGLKIAILDGARAKGTVKAYSERPVSLDALDDLAGHLASFMRGGAESYLDRIRELGCELTAMALPESARDTLRETRLGHLRLQVDDSLAHVPWELLYDGEQFLGMRFAVGRLIATRSESRGPSFGAQPEAGGHALVVSDPAGDLSHAAREGEAVAGLLHDGFVGEVRHLHSACTRADFLEALRGCRLLHFAGHAMPPVGNEPGGFRLADGLATAAEIVDPMRGRPPALVFSNSCFASTDTGWSEAARGTNDVASTLLLQGVRHYIGPKGDISDRDALSFALRFYEQALAGETLGQSVRHARRALAQAAAEPISFAGYLLYGDPRDHLPAGSVRFTRQPTRSAAAAPSPMLPDVTPLPPPRAATGTPATGGRSKLLAGIAVAALLAVGLVGWLVSRGTPDGTTPGVGAVTRTPENPPTLKPPMRRTGPLRLSVLPFKNTGTGSELVAIAGGVPEAVVTELATVEGIELVERYALTNEALDRNAIMVKDVLGEIQFGEGRFVDASTAAALGKLHGTEVALVGAYQKAGKTLRITARFVDVETGEILHALKVQGAADDPFTLQDEVATRAREAIGTIRNKLRPAGE